MRPEIVVTDKPEASDREAILAGLIADSEGKAGSGHFTPLAILLRDPGSGATIGGLWGHTLYNWLFVELICVPPELRGQDMGTELMSRAEAIARERGCVGARLDTFEFQAPGFYEKLGYTRFGRIDDHPRGYSRFFMQKRL